MKIKLLFLLLFSFILSLQAQEKTINLSMGAGYANQIYYKLKTETATSFGKNIWDIAFLRTSNFAQGIRVNDGAGIKVYQVADNPNQWNSVNVNSQSSWTELFNSSTKRSEGAFNKGTASYGWGDYNSTTHHITGKIIFVLKYANGEYKKFICEDYFGAYTFKYASWNGTAWSTDKTATVTNSSNPNNNYNYYSLKDNKEVISAPEKTVWDLVFTRYTTDVGGGTMYSVTGVLQGDDVTVAKATGSNTSSLSYSSNINTIGYNWKSFTGSGFSVNSNRKHYIKYSDGTIYKLYFTSFGGAANGNVTFKFEDVTTALDIEEVGEAVTFGIYPNPVSSNRKINIIYDVNKVNAKENTVEIYNVMGQQVYISKIGNNQGFYRKEIDVSSLKKGVYMLRFTSGKYKKTKKMVVQ